MIAEIETYINNNFLNYSLSYFVSIASSTLKYADHYTYLKPQIT